MPLESSFATKSALFGPKNVCPFQILDLTLIAILCQIAILRQFTVTALWYIMLLTEGLNSVKLKAIAHGVLINEFPWIYYVMHLLEMV